MLKRISKIQNIGRFKDTVCGGATFDKITFIYGRNTYGKSTLGDIFSSIEGSLELITKRKTIPIDNKPQLAVLSFLGVGPNETTVSFGQTGWQPDLPDGLKLYVFDDGFYHSNVFSSRKFTRDTKENLSAFILGQQGVAKAARIAEKNKSKSEAVRRRNTLSKDVFSGITNLDHFLKMQISEPQQTIQTNLETFRSQYSELLKQQKNSAGINAREELSVIFCDADFKNLIEPINEILVTSVANYHENAKKIVTSHIQNCFQSTDRAEGWIAQGLSQNNGDVCQFCGQQIGVEAKELLESYRKYFDDAYLQNEKMVNQHLDQRVSNFLVDRVTQLKFHIDKNASILSLYSEIIESEPTQVLRNQMLSLQNEIFILLDKYNGLIAEIKSLLDISVAAKKLAPHVAVPPVTTEQIDLIVTAILQVVNKYNQICRELNNQISVLKNSLNETTVVKKLDEIKVKGELEAIKLKRLELAIQCDEYSGLLQIITNLEQEIPLLQEELSVQQSQYLSNYFLKLNNFFREFGSENFSLEKGSDTSGHKPIYYLKVKFQGVDIPEKDLDRVFSESDRRALALAVFWSSIDGLTPVDKLNAIIILDDPVTSFDNHRISALHRAILDLSAQARQVIILSHFQEDVVKFLSVYRKNKPVNLLEIIRQSGTSTLVQPDIEEFLYDDHEKKRKGIFKFINEQTNSHFSGDLRIFLELEIEYRFAKQIHDFQIKVDDLSARINELANNGVISSDIQNQLHAWREALNPDHHNWTGADLEDQRRTAKRFMEFLFEKMVVVSALEATS